MEKGRHRGSPSDPLSSHLRAHTTPVCCLLPIFGCFWPQGVVAWGRACSRPAASSRRRRLGRAPPRLSVALSPHHFLQHYTGSTSNTTAAGVQPFLLNGAVFFPEVSPLLLQPGGARLPETWLGTRPSRF